MPTRRFNYTHCRRIRRELVDVRIDTSAEPATISADFDVTQLDLPEEAEVVLEAYVDWTIMRFPYGKVAEHRPPSSTALSEFDSLDGVKCRLKVLGTGEHSGLILAEADGIHPSAPGAPQHARSFVLVRPADLGSVVWQVTFDETEPILQVNERLADWKSFLNAPGIRALLLPEVLRQLLREAVQRGRDEEAESDWPRQCDRLVASLGYGALPDSDDDDEAESWVDDVVRKFAQRHRLWAGVAELFDTGDS